MFTLGIPNATVTEAAISRAVTRRRADILSRARATVRRAALMAALLLVDIPPLTTVTLAKSARMMESCHSETVARVTGRQPTEGGEHYGELSEYQHGLLDGQQGRR